MRKFLGSVGLLALGLTAIPAVAQDSATEATADKDGGSLTDEILVVATRNESSVQNVGISVSAFTGDQLKTVGISDSTQLVQITPGLQNPQSGSGATSSYSIRGVTQTDFGFSQEAPVALYLDDVYQASQGGAAFQIFDLERVEVLRGPQGTLFGRNATGGLVHYLTKKPSDRFEGYVDASYGTFDRVKLEGAVNVPLGDAIFARASIITDSHGNIATNRAGRNLWDRDELAGRVQFLLKPDADVELLLSARFGKRRNTGSPYDAVPATPTGFGGTGVFNTAPGATDFFGFAEPDDGPFVVAIDDISKNNTNTWGATAHLTWEIGGITLTSISDVSDIRLSYVEDADVQPGEYYHYFADTDQQQISQELRISGLSDGLFWNLGGYYLRIRGNYAQAGKLTDLGLGVDQQTALYFLDTDSYSLFGQAEIDLTDKLTFTGGLRWTRDKKVTAYENFFTIDGVPDKIAFGASGSPNLIDFAGSDSQSLWAVRAQLDYHATDRILLYASYNRGVKAFGYNAPVDPSGSTFFIDPTTFDPAPGANDAFKFDDETLNAFEVGIKSKWDGVRFNLAAFYYDYKNYQALNLSGITQIITNNDARMYGADAELFASPIDGMDIVLGASYLDAKVKDIDVGGLLLDRQIAYAPKWSLTGLIRQEFEIGTAGTFAVQMNARYTSSQFLGVSNAAVLREGGYLLANARISYKLPDTDLEIAGYVNNLGDIRYRVLAFDTSAFFGNVENQFGRPREWGISASYRF